MSEELTNNDKNIQRLQQELAEIKQEEKQAKQQAKKATKERADNLAPGNNAEIAFDNSPADIESLAQRKKKKELLRKKIRAEKAKRARRLKKQQMEELEQETYDIEPEEIEPVSRRQVQQLDTFEDIRNEQNQPTYSLMTNKYVLGGLLLTAGVLFYSAKKKSKKHINTLHNQQPIELYNVIQEQHEPVFQPQPEPQPEPIQQINQPTISNEEQELRAYRLMMSGGI